jgi:uncharacterized membrane protein
MASFILSTILSISGIYVSYRIFKEKRSHKPMVCPLDGECDTVLQSKYAKFLGVNLEYAGLGYYGFLLIGYLFLIFINIPAISTILFLATFAGFIFSVYLTAIQKWAIKKWCTWCLFSAGITTLMFIVSGFTIFSSQAPLMVLTDLAFWINSFVGIGSLILIIKSLGIVVGFSSALITDILSFKFLKDFQIDEREDKNLLVLSQITWVAVGFIIISFFSSEIIKIDFLSQEVVGAGTTILLIIILNEVIFRGMIVPRLITYRLYSNSVNVVRLIFLRKLALSLNLVSIISWLYLLAILIFGLKESFFFVDEIIGEYLLVSSVAIVILHIFLKSAENTYKRVHN